MMITIPVKPVTECVAIAKGAKYRDTAAILPATNKNSKIAQKIHVEILTKCFGIFNVRPKELQSIMT